MKYKFFNYSGTKFNYTETVNDIISSSDKNIYVEPFVGSGAILFNLDKKFDEYIINDIDKNITRIYETFKEIDYRYFIEKEKYIFEMFGQFKASPKDITALTSAKENYYNFRNWFNTNHWGTDTIDEGVYCYMLANMVINSMLRFGPNGMNQSFGNRHYTMDEVTFNNIHSVLQKATIYNTDYTEVIKLYPNACYFLDPPYFSQKSSYAGFDKKQFIEFLELIKPLEYVYTDIQNVHNEKLTNKKFIRDMVSTSPSTNKKATGNLEYIFSTLEFPNYNVDW